MAITAGNLFPACHVLKPRFPMSGELRDRAARLLNLERELFGAWCSYLFSGLANGPRCCSDLGGGHGMIKKLHMLGTYLSQFYRSELSMVH